MKTEILPEYFVECFIKHEMGLNGNLFLREIVAHWDCQDTDNDGRVECYFYVPKHAVDTCTEVTCNKAIAEMLGVIPTDMIEPPTDSGHEGEYRFEYIVNLTTFE